MAVLVAGGMFFLLMITYLVLEVMFGWESHHEDAPEHPPKGL